MRHGCCSRPGQIVRAGCWIARANENASAQGSRTSGGRNRTFMAFNRAVADALDWPPVRNIMPGTAAGTTRSRLLHRSVGRVRLPRAIQTWQHHARPKRHPLQQHLLGHIAAPRQIVSSYRIAPLPAVLCRPPPTGTRCWQARVHSLHAAPHPVSSRYLGI